MTEENQHQETKVVEQETKSVDIYGTTIELPVDQANSIIQARDEKTRAYNEAQEKIESSKLAAAEAQRKADAIEAAKAGEMEKAEQLFAQQYQEKIAKYEAHTFRSAVKAELASRNDLVEGALDDALSSIIASNKFELTEDFQIKTGEKTVKELVEEFVDARSYMKKAVAAKPSQNLPTKIEKPQKPPKSNFESLRSGLESFAKKK